MKQIILTLMTAFAAIIALTITSCSKDADEDLTDDAIRYYYMVAINEDLAKYGTFTVNITEGSKTYTEDLVSKAQKVTNGSLTLYLYDHVSLERPKISCTYTPNDLAKSLTDDTIIPIVALGFEKGAYTLADLPEDGLHASVKTTTNVSGSSLVNMLTTNASVWNY